MTVTDYAENILTSIPELELLINIAIILTLSVHEDGISLILLKTK